MEKTRIFLSSTCFDLKSVRESIREKIEELGHEALASEYSSFPVEPGLSTVENCKKVIRDYTDILVLIIGGKRGSSDPSSSRSVVNAEYIEARSHGLDVFIFVEKTVWDLLPIYKDNPQADFSKTVDHNDVFKFIEEVKTDGNWVYCFSRTEEIVSVIRDRLSSYLRMLIEQKRRRCFIIPREFTYESETVLSLIQERPPFWEHLLTCSLIEDRVGIALQRLKDVNDGLECKPIESIESVDGALYKIKNLMEDIVNLIYAIGPLFEKIMEAWGPSGSPGNPIYIYNAVEKMSQLMNSFIDWEVKVKYISVPDEFIPLYKSMTGSTSDVFNIFSNLSPQIRKVIKNASEGRSQKSVKIEFNLKDIPTMDKINQEMEKLNSSLGYFYK